jgi:hypothetical protein
LPLQVRGELHLERHGLRSQYSNVYLPSQAVHGHGLEYGFELFTDVERDRLVSGGQRDRVQRDGEHDVLSLQVLERISLERHRLRVEYADLRVPGQTGRGHRLEHGVRLRTELERQRLGAGEHDNDLQHYGEHDVLPLQMRGQLHLGWYGLRRGHADIHLRGQAGDRYGLEHGFELHADVERQRLGACG